MEKISLSFLKKKGIVKRKVNYVQLIQKNKLNVIRYLRAIRSDGRLFLNAYAK